MKELFEVPVTLSPFKQWKRDNGVTTHLWLGAGDYDEHPWTAFPPGKTVDTCDPELCGFGLTKIEACYHLAKIHGLVWYQTGKVAV